jgi:hypothetical protein
MDVDVDMNTLLSPPIAFIFFLVLLFIVYVLIQRYAAKGLDHPDKHLPYSGGQKLPPTEVRLSYEDLLQAGSVIWYCPCGGPGAGHAAPQLVIPMARVAVPGWDFDQRSCFGTHTR